MPRSTCADGTTVQNAACCAFIPVRDALISDIFEGTCGENAHSTVRIAFHDAIGFSTSGGKGGGADGSMIAFGDTELAFSANAGIDEIVDDLMPFAIQQGISFGDVIQFGSSVALSLCPGAPVVQTFVGRGNATAPAPDGTVPDPFNPVSMILARMADAGFSPDEVIALLASHSIAAQDEIEPNINRSPFDSTPGVFDNQVFLEVQLRGTLFPGNGSHEGEVESPMPGEFRLQSDHEFARDSRTACTWQSFALNQALMAQKFSTAMTKLSLLGHSQSDLIDCTEIIPQAPPSPRKQAFFPAGQTHDDIEQACATQAFPTTLSTQAGATTSVARVPEQ
ncbi:fungal versatile peroxidase from pleurotus Eryngii [Exidia glandulosa HHB12029]|uniref:Peroxidase n=1 Tax=Exidia glandulosa HHB12029 TaxID=1314781 RepID=A0A166A6Q3_EXIGL|nr:fungal versatile peroxidase from pleurotus Eryngii [Exidia glandulosa HHB12029]